MNAQRFLGRAFRNYFPKRWIQYQLARSPTEPEFRYLDDIVPRSRTSIDAGANIGKYTFKLATLTPRVHAFEPLNELAALLKRTCPANVIVHNTALSDHTGAAQLHVPSVGGRLVWGWASLNGIAAEAMTQPVILRKLDDVISEDVGFIKIDVEGHELKLLRGATRIIEKCRPIFLIECEERHNTGGVKELLSVFRSAGYSGRFLRAGRVLDTSMFDAEIDQSLNSANYANNFFFFPDTAPF